MVSTLDSGSGGPGSSPGRGTVLCSWVRYFTLIVTYQLPLEGLLQAVHHRGTPLALNFPIPIYCIHLVGVYM